MKEILTFLAFCFFCSIAISNDSCTGQQKRKETINPNLGNRADSLTSKADTISNYSINISGRLNSVQITNDKPFAGNQDTTAKGKNNLNVIEIKGESNSINISQSNTNNNVNIKQNGNNNQINISQGSRDSEK
jgi:hypothetical protein